MSIVIGKKGDLLIKGLERKVVVIKPRRVSQALRIAYNSGLLTPSDIIEYARRHLLNREERERVVFYHLPLKPVRKVEEPERIETSRGPGRVLRYNVKYRCEVEVDPARMVKRTISCQPIERELVEAVIRGKHGIYTIKKGLLSYSVNVKPFPGTMYEVDRDSLRQALSVAEKVISELRGLGYSDEIARSAARIILCQSRPEWCELVSGRVVPPFRVPSVELRREIYEIEDWIKKETGIPASATVEGEEGEVLGYLGLYGMHPGRFQDPDVQRLVSLLFYPVEEAPLHPPESRSDAISYSEPFIDEYLAGAGKVRIKYGNVDVEAIVKNKEIVDLPKLKAPKLSPREAAELAETILEAAYTPQPYNFAKDIVEVIKEIEREQASVKSIGPGAMPELEHLPAERWACWEIEEVDDLGNVIRYTYCYPNPIPYRRVKVPYRWETYIEKIHEPMRPEPVTLRDTEVIYKTIETLPEPLPGAESSNSWEDWRNWLRLPPEEVKEIVQRLEEKKRALLDFLAST